MSDENILTASDTTIFNYIRNRVSEESNEVIMSIADIVENLNIKRPEVSATIEKLKERKLLSTRLENRKNVFIINTEKEVPQTKIVSAPNISKIDELENTINCLIDYINNLTDAVNQNSKGSSLVLGTGFYPIQPFNKN